MDVAQFILETRWSDLPAITQQQALRCLLDTVGTGLAGRLTPLSGIIVERYFEPSGLNSARKEACSYNNPRGLEKPQMTIARL